nr:hypothetical protein [Microbispora sp. GKU 823]
MGEQVGGAGGGRDDGELVVGGQGGRDLVQMRGSDGHPQQGLGGDAVAGHVDLHVEEDRPARAQVGQASCHGGGGPAGGRGEFGVAGSAVVAQGVDQSAVAVRQAHLVASAG